MLLDHRALSGVVFAAVFMKVILTGKSNLVVFAIFDAFKTLLLLMHEYLV